jgi:putative flippase GtrA
MENQTPPANPPQTNPLLGQFLRFAVVGGINTGVDFAVYNLLLWATGIEKGEKIIVLNVISFSVAVINSYFLNKWWAFKDQEKSEQAKKFTLFLLVSVIGAAINSGTVYYITTYVPVMFGLSPKLWANAAKIVATGLSLIWNFVGYKLFVFKK